MPATCDVYDGCPESDLPLIRELLALDVMCPASCTFVRDELGQLQLFVPPGPLHWSRQGEWPWVLRNADLRPGQKVLDAGSGWSVLKFALAKRCAPGPVVCLEYDPEFMAKAQPAIEQNALPNVVQVQGDVRRIPYPDNWFERVVCVSVVEHMPTQHLDAVKELVRVTKPGGRLLLTLDVRLNDARDVGDFHLDQDGVLEILGWLKCPLPVSKKDRVLGSRQMDGKIEIVVLMVKYDKPE